MNSSGPLPWWLEYYLHGLGPLLQWVDALLIYRGFRRPLRAVPLLVGLTGAYVLWVEVVVQRANETPVGTVTDGLPYPFLNSMEYADRLVFYGVTAGTGLVFLAGFWFLAVMIRSLRRGAQQDPSGSPGI